MEDDLEDDWEEQDEDDSKYWFTRDKIDKITTVHDYLDKLDGVGKVILMTCTVQLNL